MTSRLEVQSQGRRRCSRLASVAFGSSAARADEIVIGASLPLSGPLAGFGSFQQWGYKRAVDEVNKAGGISSRRNQADGEAHHPRRQDRSQRQRSNTETLISRDHAVAMLGSCTPALVNAGALVAERAKKPMVTGCDPLEAFKSVRKWNYVWDLFFDEPELAAAQYKALAETRAYRPTRRSPSGTTTVPTDRWSAARSGRRSPRSSAMRSCRTPSSRSTTRSSPRSSAKPRARAQTSCSSTRSPRRRSRSASRWRRPATRRRCSISKRAPSRSNSPKRSANCPTAFWSAAIGIRPSPIPARRISPRPSKARPSSRSSQHIADSYAAAQVLLDAIAAAGSTDPEKINAAIAKTDKTYVVGPVKFDEDHTAKLPIVALQWQGGKTVIVWPKSAKTGELLVPAA